MNSHLRKPQVVVPTSLIVLIGLVSWYASAKSQIALILLAIALLALVWFGSAWLIARMRKRKQGAFDAGVAAREGIADRKREWESWTEELDKQGIDRYELPFYLLVGEPQSGKSVLLQNSDLTFPFGQSRLSGIGGTRGCDWWFTEEAVVLDLAGRLFTHEGGASDEKEWEAFLDLLSSYRPTAPANGVMLVIPCDGLLADSREEVSRKSNSIQSALLTLTNKLQAQVPIYVILTKADRIFGFAETVHRLDADKRNGMFGWSRDAEHFDEPFDIVEVREAFAGIVERARMLRETMLSSLRLPEGIGEADRMFAFPDELEGLLPSLEFYLKRIFSESSLVDRLFFRGVYLTSGLQTGAPIVKVCADIFGGTGEADKRDLEALFSKQQAYFIKDLIRRRVFSETGLVRPTAARVKTARRNAWIGYGLSAAVAVVSVVVSLRDVISDHGKATLTQFRTAIDRSDKVAQPLGAGLKEVLVALAEVQLAESKEELLTESQNFGRKESFRKLYRSLFDHRLTPAVRESAEKLALAEAEKDDPKLADQLAQAAHLTALMQGFQLTPRGLNKTKEEAGVELPAALTPVLELLSKEDRENVKTAIELRAQFGSEPPPVSAPEREPGGRLAEGTLEAAFELVNKRWNDVFQVSPSIQVTGPARYLVAWMRMREAYDALGGFEVTASAGPSAEQLRAATSAFTAAADALRPDDLLEKVPTATKVDYNLSALKTEAVLAPLARAREAFLRAAKAEKTDWEELAELWKFANDNAFGQPKEDSSERSFKVVTDVIHPQLAPAVRGTCRPLPEELSSKVPAPALLAYLRGRLDALAATDPPPPTAWRVLRAQARVLAPGYESSYRDWRSLARSLEPTLGESPDIKPALDRLVTHLTALRAVTLELDAGAAERAFSAWTGHVDTLLAGCLQAALDSVTAWTPDFGAGGAAPLSTSLSRSLQAITKPSSADYRPHADLAQQLWLAHVDKAGRALLERWKKKEVDGVAALKEVDAFLAARKAEGVTGTDSNKWLEQADAILSAKIETHQADFDEAVRQAIPAGEQLQTIANAIADKCDADWLRKWGEGLVASDVPDFGSGPDGPTPQSEESPDKYLERLKVRSEEWRSLDSTARAAQRYATVTRRVSVRDAKLQAPLRELAAALRVSNPGGPSIAAAIDTWFASTKQRLDEPLQPSAQDSLLMALGEKLVDVALKELNTLYVKGFEALFRDEDLEPLLRFMFETDPTRLPTEPVQIAALHRGLDELFGRQNRYAELGQRFRIKHYWPSTPNEPRVLKFDEPRYRNSNTEASVWELDRFLLDLRRFFTPGEGVVPLGKWKLELQLVPKSPIGGQADFWNSPTYAYLFTSLYDPEKKNYIPLPALPDYFAKFEWTEDAASRPIFFQWSQSAADPPDRIDVGFELGSLLGPLVMAWAHGKPESQSAAPGGFEDWEVTYDVNSNPERRIRFTLTFDRPLPQRPAASPF